MTLLLRAEEVQTVLRAIDPIEVTHTLVLDYLEGTTLQMAPFGGYGGSGQPPLPRVAAGVMTARGRMNVRGGDLSMLFDLADHRVPLAIIAVDPLEPRVMGSVGLACRHLARPDPQVLAIIGSGNVARGAVLGVCAARPVKEIRVYSPTSVHREAFASWAEARVAVPSRACHSLASAIEGATIVATATSARAPLLRYGDLRPGTLVLGLGSDHEIDESVYLGATQLVATSRSQMLAAGGSGQTGQGIRNPRGPLARLLESGALSADRLLDLGAIVRADIAARNGSGDIVLYLDARGGVADAALVSAIYERALALRIGTEFDFREATGAGTQRTGGASR